MFFKIDNIFCQDIVAGQSNAGVYVGTFLLLAVLVIGGVVLFFCLRFTSLTFCQMMPEFLLNLQMSIAKKKSKN